MDGLMRLRTRQEEKDFLENGIRKHHGKLRITQIRSTIGRLPKHRRTIKALGLGRIRKSVVHNDTRSYAGWSLRSNIWSRWKK